MPLPVIANVYRCALHWTNNAGAIAVNVLHVQKASSNEDAILVELDTHVDSDMWFPISSDFHVDKVTIIKLDGTSAGKEFSPITPANWDGGLAGTWSPQVAALVRLGTAQRGARGRGRVFLGPCAEAATADGSWQSDSNRAACETAWKDFNDDLTADGFTFGIASYKHADFHAITNVRVPSVLATQKDRQNRLRV